MRSAYCQVHSCSPVLHHLLNTAGSCKPRQGGQVAVEQARKQTPQTHGVHSCSSGLPAPELLPVLFAVTEVDRRRQRQWQRSRCCSGDRIQRECCRWRLHSRQHMSPAASARRRAGLVQQAWHGAQWAVASMLGSLQLTCPPKLADALQIAIHCTTVALHPTVLGAPKHCLQAMRKAGVKQPSRATEGKSPVGVLAGCAWPHRLQQETITATLRLSQARHTSRVAFAEG